MAGQTISLPAQDFPGVAFTSVANKESSVASNWQRLLIDAVSRGYIQHWLKGETIPEKSAQKIFSVASQILRAGQLGQSGGGQ